MDKPNVECQIISRQDNIFSVLGDLFINNCVLDISHNEIEHHIPAMIDGINKADLQFRLKLIQDTDQSLLNSITSWHVRSYVNGEKIEFDTEVVPQDEGTKARMIILKIPQQILSHLERRVFRAVLYDHAHPVTLKSIDSNKTIEDAFIRDLSIYGMKVFAPVSAQKSIRQFDEVVGTFSFDGVVIECMMQIRWIDTKSESDGYVVLGCEFHALKPFQEQAIASFVNQVQQHHLRSYESRIDIEERDIPVIICTEHVLECIGTLYDLSIQGCKAMLISDSSIPFEKNSIAKVRIKFGIGKILHAEAKIVWMQKATSRVPQSVGLEFMDLTMESKRLIMAFMNQVQKAFLMEDIKESITKSKKKKAG